MMAWATRRDSRQVRTLMPDRICEWFAQEAG
jgi:hypothetical protein